MDVRHNDKDMEEKLDSSVPGQTSVSLNYLPIKKRRSWLRSPSPPLQTPSDGTCAPHYSVSELNLLASNSLAEVQRSRGIENDLLKTNFPPSPQRTSLEGICAPLDSVCKPEPLASDGLVEVQRSEGIENALGKTNLPHTEDSSAVDLPASDAGKNNNVNDVPNAEVGVNEDKLLTPQGTNACLDVSSLEKTTAGIGENPFMKDSISEAHNDSLDQIDSTTVSSNLLDKTENKVEKGSSSAKDVRLHWDLNTVMDEWELPANDQSIFSTGNGVANLSIEGLHSAVSDRLDNSIGFDDSVNAWRLLKCKSDINGPAQPISKLKYLGNGSSLGGRTNTPTKLTMLAQENLCTSEMQLGKTPSVKNVKLEKQDDVFVDSAVPDNSKCGLVCIKSEEEHIKSYDIPSNEATVPKFTIPADACCSSSKSEKAVLPNVLSDNQKTSLEVTTLDECRPVLDYVKKENDACAPPAVAPLGNSLSDVDMKELMPKSCELFGPPKIASLIDPSSDVEIKELVPKANEQFGPPKVATLVSHLSVIETKELMPKSCEHSGEVALEDPLDDGDVSDLSLGGHDHLVHLGKETKYPTGCESPFEDGEVREADALSWEENEYETECLDYDIDDGDVNDFGTGNHCMSEAGSQSIHNEDNVNLMEKGTCGSVSSLKESSTSASIENVSGQDQIAMAVGANNNKPDEMVTSVSIHRLDAKGSFTEEIRSRDVKAKLSSRLGELPASSVLDEKDTLYMQQGRSGSRFQAGQVFRSDKYSGKDRHVPRMPDERPKNNWNGSPSSFLESRNHFQNNYRRGGLLPLPRSSIPDSETDGEGLANRGQRRSTNYSSKGVYRPFVMRRPLDNSDNPGNRHKGNIESRDDGHGMIRGRSGIYHRGGFRGPRGEHRGPISGESAQSSAWMPERRRRSSSPFLSRNHSFSRPCRRSQSRSRTRSPIPWRMQEERNKGPRMERTRIHYGDSKFEESDDAFCSPPRKRFSSQGNSGSFNDRNGGPSRFRERNSPGRFIEQRQRFDSRGSVERMKSDEGFRPRVHPQRFSKPSGEVWRGHNYDNKNNERTKYSDRNEMIRQVRQSDNSGAFRRFRNDAEDCFDENNNRNDNSWEGRGPFKYDRERM